MKENAMSMTNEPNSLVYIQASESYPKKKIVCDDQSLAVPFPELTGENVEYLGKSSDATLAISNFRFFALLQHAFISIPLMLIGSLEWKGKELPELILWCKDGRSFQLKFDNSEDCGKWYDRLKKKFIACQERLEKFFSFAFHAWCLDTPEYSPFTTGNNSPYQNGSGDLQNDFLNEYKRMGFNKDNAWKITEINSKFDLCPSYPKLHIVPSHITDEELEKVARFRTGRRFPSAVWRNRRNGAVIVRCSQPEVGLLYRRCTEDEYFLQSLGSTVVVNKKDKPFTNGLKTLPNGTSCHAEVNGVSPDHRNSIPEKPNCIRTDKKVLVLDCRSYYVALGNKLKGGGMECTEYYPNCEVQFMNLANIHTIRTSFQSLRELCCKQDDNVTWLSSLEATQWLFHISLLIKTSLVVVKAVEQDKQHVVIHCSDGWDRTTQVVALAQLLLDPFYRTIKGFRVLLEREWLAFGHKFADRCGHSCHGNDQNERCPVFVQWLDCVHQLLRQFPCSFEFNETFLVKLAQHTYSCLFGTFLCNTEQERLEANIRQRTFSVWSLLDSQSRKFRNFLYSPLVSKILYPECQVRSVLLWSSLYLTSPVVIFDILSTNTSDTALSGDSLTDTVHRDTRPSTLRRNSDGDVSTLLLNSEDRHNTGPEFRDDTNSELFLAKSHSCKSCFDPSKYPGKGLVLNGLPGNFEKNENDVSVNGMFEISLDNSEKQSNGVEDNVDDRAEVSLDNSENPPDIENVNGLPEVPLEDSGNSSNAIDGSINDLSGDTVEDSEKPSEGSDGSGGDSKEEDIKTCSLTSSSRTLVEEPGRENAPYDMSAEGLQETLENGGGEEEGCTTVDTSQASNCYSNNHCPENNSRLFEGLVEDGLKTSCDSPYNKIRKLLDVDGLTMITDPVQSRLLELEKSYRVQIDELQTQLQTQSCLCEPRSRSSIKPEIASLLYPTFDGPNSLSTDTCGSWEHVEDDDVNPTLWVPDHLAVTCCGCDVTFSVTNRKHHCRSCGNVFCNLCCSNMTPVPTEQHYDPVRVCMSCFEKLHVPNVQDITVSAS